ncbi:zinc finger protein 493-like [Bradysia coprophila]|uniref:zinc finger protein 493-like n=1 Tax=Bradysia coprophila TaxID=38358 RepID=UPI00187D7A78|nr:zinc finger protein 493-like [Bradysia coprophila]
MQTNTKDHSTNGMSSTKAAEIYRKDCGGIYYVCFHCGIQFASIADTLVHIDHHFSSESDMNVDQAPMDIVDRKCELLDNVTEEVVDPSQLEQIFIDCSKSIETNDEQSMPINTATYTVIHRTTVQPRKNYSDLEGHFEWKCLYCSSLWKKFTKLKQHLRKHYKDPLPNVIPVATEREFSSLTSTQYSFKCTLCPSEFFDSITSRQHVKDCHATEPLECIPCGRKFVSTQLLTDHMSTVHDDDDTKLAIMSDNCKNEEQQEIQNNNETLLSQQNTFLCILCNKTFNGTLNLMQHTFVHFNLKNFSCTQCPAKFRRMATLRDHMVKKHLSDIDEHIFNIQCRFCNDKVENLFEFVTHTFTNHLDEGDRNNSDLDTILDYDCRFCFKTFTKWNDAYQHLGVHAKDELPECIPNEATTARAFSERAKSGLYRFELLYNCKECPRTLCGSFEARNHWITEHKHVIKSEIVPSEKLNKRTGKESLKCHDCDEVFCTQFNLMKHRLMHFKVQPYRCPICAKRFSVSRNVPIHVNKVHNTKPDDNYCQLDCHYCKAEFSEEISFITHMYNEHLYVNFNIEENLDGRCQYECLYCKEMIAQRSQMSQHLLENHPNETLPETESNTITAESSMNSLRHKVEFIYCCVHCPKKFRLPHPANEHVKYKHKIEKKPVQKKEKEKKAPVSRDTHCTLCNITFLTWRSMLNHRAKRHPETHNKDRYKNRPTYYCSTCGKEYRDKGNLNQHEETHARLQSYTCDICNKSYRTKNYIQLHLLSHRNEKNFICDQCGRSFYSVSKLNTHSQIHQNLKLQCDMCDKVFFTRYNLSKHKKTHTTDTRRKCKLCDNYFKSANSYRTHMLLHTGIKKYACRYCDMAFAQSSGRRGHEKMKHHIA